MARIIYHHQLPAFAQILMALGPVLAPLEKKLASGASKHYFGRYQPGSVIVPNYPPTVLPPKEFLLPPEDTVLEFSKGKSTQPVPEPQVIFGVNYEDLEGLAKLVEIFSKPIVDKPLTARAQKTTLVAIDRFSPPKKISFDIYLQRISNEKYAAFAGSPRGQRLLKNPLFKTEALNIPKVTKKEDPLITNNFLADAVIKSQGSPIWDELAERCFACGVCAFVCPLCYCFETEDHTTLPTTEPPTGKRVRSWSSCFSPDFATTSGHSFRPERRDRIYNWYFHKFVRMTDEHGFPGCVDCGRCLALCPAKINYRKVLSDVLREYPGRQK